MRKDLSGEGAALIQHFESCKLRAYPDPGSELGLECGRRRVAIDEYDSIIGWETMDGDPWTIGWGHTGSDVHPGLSCTKDDANRWFDADTSQFVDDVNNLLGDTQVTQNEFDALVSFAYNCGSDIDGDDIAEGLGDSTLLKRVKAGDITGAANEFQKWNKSQGRVTPGLVRRRAAERALFLGHDWRAAAGLH